MRDDAPVAWAAIDFLCCLLLVVFTLIAPPVQAHSSIQTLGRWAVIVTWPDGVDDDVDTYVRAPTGEIVFFNRVSGALMHLEVDDMGIVGDSAGGVNLVPNHERVILRGVIPGEYVVNLHAYRFADSNVPVTVELYRLEGVDRAVLTRQVILEEEGSEHTAFRFTLRPNGSLAGTSDLPAQFVMEAQT